MGRFLRHRGPHHIPMMIHDIICQHQIEIEVWPSEAEVYFQDERYVDPVNTQVRFDAVVYNAPSGGVLWQVASIGGGSGAGSIDPTGLYTAPPKGSLPHGLTDLIIATAADDPLRKAYARVTLVGFGPAPTPQPKIEIFPKQVYLYYPSGEHNAYIDASNTMQVFRTIIRNSASTEVEWSTDDGTTVPVGWYEPWYRYEVKLSGPGGVEVRIEAKLKNNPGIKDEAVVVKINYKWPGLT